MKILLRYICILLLITAVRSKSYDLEHEALRLYADDLSEVLHNFRKSLDYVHILSDRVSVFKTEIETMGNGLYYHELNSMNLELRYACSGCEPNETSCKINKRRKAVSSLAELELDEYRDDKLEKKIERKAETTPDDTERYTALHDAKKSKTSRGGTKAKITETDEKRTMLSINFVSTAMRKRALEKYRAVFNPMDDDYESHSLSKTIDHYGHMLREKPDKNSSTTKNTTKSALKILNDYPMRRYNKNKYVDIAFKHAKQLISGIISTFSESVETRSAVRTYGFEA